MSPGKKGLVQGRIVDREVLVEGYLGICNTFLHGPKHILTGNKTLGARKLENSDFMLLSVLVFAYIRTFYVLVWEK